MGATVIKFLSWVLHDPSGWAARRMRQQDIVFKDMILTEDGLAKFGRLVTEVRLAPDLHTNCEAMDVSKPLAEKYEHLSELSRTRILPLTWLDLHTLESAVRAMTPTNALGQVLASLRSEYRTVVSQEVYDQYLQSCPARSKDAAEAEASAQIEINLLVSALQRIRAITLSRERIRSQLSTRVLLLELGLCILLGTIYECLVGIQPSIMAMLNLVSQTALPKLAPTLTLVVLLGSLGGVVSLQQRLQSAYPGSDPVNNVAELRYGAVSLYFAPASGAIFAVILFFIFAANMVQGTFFPAISVIGYHLSGGVFKDTQDATLTLDNLANLAPKTVCDMAKLLVWCFIAGFAERFVPDTLDRLVGQSRVRSERLSIQNQAQRESAALFPQPISSSPSAPGGA